jgi:hypothetical protein
MADSGVDAGRLGRLLALIAIVTALALFTSSQRLEGELFQLAAVSIGAVAVVTAMIGVLIAMSAAFDASEPPS